VPTVSAPPAAAIAPPLGRRELRLLLVLCGALFLDALDVSMTGVALPSIRRELHLSASSLQWIVSAYVLGYGGFLLLGGRAADLFGRRRVFVWSLAVFVLASGLGAVAHTGSLLIATRFIKGVAAAFTAPAGLSLITTGFAEGPSRNRALAIYTATGASGFSLGLVFSGLLTEIGWRWVFAFPVPIALITLLAAIRTVPADLPRAVRLRDVDLAGAVALTASMLLLVYTLVSAPGAGWGSARTLASLAGVGVALGAFVAIERATATPLVRLAILRSGALLRANAGAMALFGGWVGFLFITTLYLQDVRGWSALQTGLAVFPSGVIVVALAPRIAGLIARFGTTTLIAAGLSAHVGAYALFLRIGPHSSYVTVVLPTVVLGGLGFALAYGPLNVAATNGIAPAEQGLAGGLVTSSFQIGGALVLAVTAAVFSAHAGAHASLTGFHAALLVPLVAALAGLAATTVRHRARRAVVPEPA
jgi:MFS family permease